MRKTNGGLLLDGAVALLVGALDCLIVLSQHPPRGVALATGLIVLNIVFWTRQ